MRIPHLSTTPNDRSKIPNRRTQSAHWKVGKRFPEALWVLLVLAANGSGCWLGSGELSDALGKGGDDTAGASMPELCIGVDDDGDGHVDFTPTEEVNLAGTYDAEVGDVPIPFKGIGAGCFQMGCTPEQTECASDEYPVHTVRLTRSFYLMQTEMTQSQFFALTGFDPSYRDGDDLPVETLTWHMAASVANALSDVEDLDPCYTCTGTGEDVVCESSADPYACEGYRLPTEAEWEYAARCGEGTRYAGSDTADEVAWTKDNSERTTHVVGTLKENGCGLYDMSGNVWEWVGDLNSGYSPDFQVDPTGDTGGPYRMYRGGMYHEDPVNSRVSSRRGSGELLSSPGLGLRLARTIP